MLHCNTNVQKCNTEIEKEIDIEIELENIASYCDTNVQKSDTEIEIELELEKDIEIEKRVRKDDFYLISRLLKKS